LKNHKDTKSTKKNSDILCGLCVFVVLFQRGEKMSRYFRIFLASLLLFSSSCSSPTPAPDNVKPKEKVSIDESRPLVQVLRQAEKIRSRFRYFGEELKTTYKPEKQSALLANVHETVHPACQEIKRIIENEKSLEHPDTARDMEAVCARIDHSLEERDLDLLKPAIRDFTPAFDRLQAAAEGKK
jgi:hypothetical protein